MKVYGRGDLLTYSSGRVSVKVRALEDTLVNGFTAVVVTGTKAGSRYPRGRRWLASPLYLFPRKAGKSEIPPIREDLLARACSRMWLQ